MNEEYFLRRDEPVKFVVFSMNGTWIKKMRSVLLQARVPYRVLRRVDSIEEIDDPSIWIIDVDTIENLNIINSIKNGENTLKLYLSSINKENAGINFPKFDIISSEITTSEIFSMMQDNKRLYDAIIAERKNGEESQKTKEEAIKELPQKPELLPAENDEDDEEDDMLIQPKPKKMNINRHEVIYEDEDSYAPFEDRHDMESETLKLENNGQSEKKEEDIEKEKAEESVSPLQKGTLVEETSIPETIPQDKVEPVKKVLYENNERADRNLKESDYVHELGIYKDPDFRCPIVKGKPIEYIGNNVSNVVDAALSKYRIKKLMKAGLDKWQIINEITKAKKKEETVRMESLKEREVKRLEFLKKFDDTKIDVSKVKKPVTEEVDDGTKLRRSLGMDTSSMNKPSVLPDSKYTAAGDGEKQPVKIDTSMPMKPKEKMKTREEILQEIENKKKEAKDRRLMMDIGTESIEELQKKRREEIRKSAERKVAQADKPGLPDLPMQKLTDRNQMAALYRDENIKRAENRSELKKSMPKPKDVAIEVDDDDDMIDKKKKKGGFFGFGKK